jgi:hypothetical protein
MRLSEQVQRQLTDPEAHRQQLAASRPVVVVPTRVPQPPAAYLPCSALDQGPFAPAPRAGRRRGVPSRMLECARARALRIDNYMARACMAAIVRIRRTHAPAAERVPLGSDVAGALLS